MPADSGPLPPTYVDSRDVARDLRALGAAYNLPELLAYARALNAPNGFARARRVRLADQAGVSPRTVSRRLDAAEDVLDGRLRWMPGTGRRHSAVALNVRRVAVDKRGRYLPRPGPLPALRVDTKLSPPLGVGSETSSPSLLEGGAGGTAAVDGGKEDPLARDPGADVACATGLDGGQCAPERPGDGRQGATPPHAQSAPRSRRSPRQRRQERGPRRVRRTPVQRSAGRPWATALRALAAGEVAELHQDEAQRQARRYAGAFAREGWQGAGADPVAWEPVLLTLAGRLGGWDQASRVLRAGLASEPKAGTWRGWWPLLAKNPRYALRESFIRAALNGVRVPRGARVEDGPAWRPLSPAAATAWERWQLGQAPEPAPDVERVRIDGGGLQSVRTVRGELEQLENRPNRAAPAPAAKSANGRETPAGVVRSALTPDVNTGSSPPARPGRDVELDARPPYLDGRGRRWVWDPECGYVLDAAQGAEHPEVGEPVDVGAARRLQGLPAAPAGLRAIVGRQAVQLRRRHLAHQAEVSGLGVPEQRQGDRPAPLGELQEL